MASAWSQGALNLDSSTAWEDSGPTSKEYHRRDYPSVFSNNSDSVRKNVQMLLDRVAWAGGVWAQSMFRCQRKHLLAKGSPELYILLHLHFLILCIVYSVLKSLRKESPIAQMFFFFLFFFLWFQFNKSVTTIVSSQSIFSFVFHFLYLIFFFIYV